MKQARILISGSKGLIGRILIENLSDSFEIYGLDLEVEKDEKYFKADISNYEELASVFEEIGLIDCIVHLAGDPKVEAEWQSVLKNNIIGTRNIYECARKYGIKKLVFASSNHVTGAYEGFPPVLHKQTNPPRITVNDSVRPDSDYGSSKAFGEIIARQYFELYGIKSICLRIGWVLRDDDPTKNERAMKMWLSHRDLIELIKRSIFSDIKFGIYYGVSNNGGGFWDISNAEKELGYKPQDDASSLT